MGARRGGRKAYAPAGPSGRRIWAEPLESRVLLNGSSLSTTAWTPIGPAPIANSLALGNGPASGRINGIAADPTDPNTLYIAAAGGGVWKTTNGGGSWTPLTDSQSTLFMGCVTVAPGNPAVIYAGTGQGDTSGTAFYGRGVLKSTDGGTTWALLGNNLFNRVTVNQIVVDPTNANTVYADVFGPGNNGVSGNTGIWKSVDGGATWTNTTASINTTIPYTDLRMDPTNPQHLLFAAGSYATSAGGLYQTVNGGTSWSLLTGAPAGAGLGNVKVAIAPSNPQVLYVSVADPNSQALLGMWTSTDGGTTWARLPNVPNYLANRGWSASVLVVDPQNAQLVYAGGQNGLLQSADGGRHWSYITTGTDGAATSQSQHTIAFDDNGRLLDGTGGGIWRLENAGAGSIAWSDLNSNLQIAQFFSIALNPTDPSSAFGGTLDNGNAQFSGSLSWVQRQSGDQGMVAFDPQNPSRIYQQTPNSPRFFSRSDDGGVTWGAKTSGINPNEPQFYPAPFWVDPNNGNHLLFGTDHIYESFNGGDTWTAISAPNTNGWSVTGTISHLVMAPSDPNTIYATASGIVFSTHDHGASWQQSIGISGPYSELVVDPSNPQVAYVTRSAFNNTHVFRTNDGGIGWSDQTGSSPPNLPTYSIVVDPAVPGRMYAGTDNGVYLTNNDGATWTAFNSGLPNVQVRDLEFDAAHNLLAAATFGRGVWEISTAPSAPLVVNTLADETDPSDGLTSLREAVAAVLISGQTITFDPSLAGGTIALQAANGPLAIGGSITVNGPTSASLTITGAAGAPIEASAGSNVELSNLSLGGSATALQVDAGGQALLENVKLAAPVIDNGTLSALQFADGSYTGPITGTGTLVKRGTANLILGSPVAVNGGINIASGNLTGNTSTLQGNINIGHGSTLVFDQSTLSSSADHTFYGLVLGSGMLHIAGPSAVVRLGVNAAQVPSQFLNAWTTTIDAGATLIATAANQFSPNSDYFVNGILDLGGFNQGTGGLAGSGIVYSLPATGTPLAVLTVGSNNRTNTFTGVLEDVPPAATGGQLGLTKIGSGTLTLASTNGASDTYSGPTTITNGLLVGNTLTLHGAISDSSLLTIDQTISGLGTGTFNATVSGGGGINLFGVVKLSPTASLSNTGSTNVFGTLIAGAPSDLSTNSQYNVSGILELGGFDQTIQSLEGLGTIYNNEPGGQNGTATLSVGVNNHPSAFGGLAEDHPAGGSGVLALRSVWGPLQLTGANTFSGGTSNAPFGTIVAGPASGNPLGTGPVSISGSQPGLTVLGQIGAPIQAPIPVTGFNQDVVVEASATDPLAATTTAFDNLDINGNNVWYEQEFGGAAAAGTGLPAGGKIVSATNPAVTFQLQPYTAANAAFVAGNNGSVTLQLTTPGQFASLNILGSASNGTAFGQIHFNFADGTTTTVPFSYADWFNNSNPVFIAGGRVLRSTGAAVSITPGNPRLYELDFNLAVTDQLKVLNSITFQETGGNSFGVFAVSGAAIRFLSAQTYSNTVLASNSTTISARGSQNVSFGGLSLDSSSISITADPGLNFSFGQVTLNGNAQLLLPAGLNVTLGPVSGPSLTQNGSGAIMLTGPNNCGQFSITGGTMVFQSASAVTANSSFVITGGLLQFAATNSPFTATLSNLSITLPGKLDLTDDALLVTNAASDPQAQVQSYVTSGAIYSSLADAHHALGYGGSLDNVIPTLNPNSMLVKLAVPGDTNLDGTVDLSDFQRLTRHFGQTNADWAEGDFNYDRTVNLSDLLILTRHFGQHYTTPTMSSIALTSSLTAAPADVKRRSSVHRPRAYPLP